MPINSGRGFKCDKCGGLSSLVFDSRKTDRNVTWRRHVCRKRKCGHRFTTYEITADAYREFKTLRHYYHELFPKLMESLKALKAEEMA